MLGIWQAYAGAYLVAVGIATLIGFGIPLLFVPLRWARMFRWDVPPPSLLTPFLGRSLGVVLCVIASYALKASVTPAAQPFFFELMLWILLGMLALHIYGALKRVQPITETIEVALWVVLVLATIAFYPVS